MIKPQQIVILLILGVLLFGRRLPEVGRSVGLMIAHFRRGLKGIEDDLREAVADGPPRPWRTSGEVPGNPEGPSI